MLNFSWGRQKIQSLTPAGVCQVTHSRPVTWIVPLTRFGLQPWNVFFHFTKSVFDEDAEDQGDEDYKNYG